jgi:5-methylthioadenosine/S-adenosylhomocysteine deaminase
MATINGADALFLSNETGTLRKGAKADLIMFNLNQPHFYPRHNLLGHLVYSARSSDINLVMVNGNVLMSDGELLTIDEERVFFEAQLRATRLVN